MIKTFWLILKISLIVAAALWIADRPGTVSVEWLSYSVTIHIGLFFLILLSVILLSILIYTTFRTLISLPRKYRKHNEIKNQQKGFEALTLGLTAVAAGDVKTAQKQSNLARKKLPQDNSLSLLLQAQTAKLAGEDDKARESFSALLEHKDTGFLGVRGLLQEALEKQDYAKALTLGRKGLDRYPDQPWLLKLVYDLEIRHKNWDAALSILKKGKKTGAFSNTDTLSDDAVILLIKADQALIGNEPKAALKLAQKAYQLDPDFIPAVLRLGTLLLKTNHRRKAVSLVEKTFRHKAHPALIHLWTELMPPSHQKKAREKIQWFKKLSALNPQSTEALIAVGKAAGEEKVWGEARTYFEKAKNIKKTESLYREWATLEEESGESQEQVNMRLHQAMQHPSSPVWYCEETGIIYEDWHPIAYPHGSFNTIKWGRPGGTEKKYRLIDKRNSL